MSRNYEIVEYLSTITGIPKYQVLDIFKNSSEYVRDKLKEDHNTKVALPYLGSFELRLRKGRNYRDNFGDGTIKKHNDSLVPIFKIKGIINTTAVKNAEKS